MSLPNVQVLCVSMDLPFGQKRWCGAEGVENVTCLRAHRCTKFGEDYGVLIKGGPLDRCLARAIFVVGADNKIKHVEYVSEIANEPNYDAALAAAKKSLVGGPFSSPRRTPSLGFVTDIFDSLIPEQARASLNSPASPEAGFSRFRPTASFGTIVAEEQYQEDDRDGQSAGVGQDRESLRPGLGQWQQSGITPVRSFEVPDALVDTGVRYCMCQNDLFNGSAFAGCGRGAVRLTTAGVIEVRIYDQVRLTIQGRDWITPVPWGP